MSERETVGSVMRACALLGLFSAARPVVTLAEMATESGLNKPTVHRLMSTLVEAGWVDRDAQGAYSIRMPLFVIASAALADGDLRALARSDLEALAGRFGDTAFLMLPADAGAVVVDRVQGGRSLQVTGIGVGTVLPFHAAAGPVVMAAYDDAIGRRMLASPAEAYTDATVVDPGSLEARLATVRRDGGTVSHGDYLDGVSAVAAPVLGRGGELVATLSLGGPSSDFRDAAGEERFTAVREAAARLTRSLEIVSA
ncbi:IclR family transcriptional regulator [Nocardioides sp. CFH 31398]|uniref:IclR family transcriptional regulator n=1 Tax=Nocardioides sp. CFH 31398 TaxID=2919579 RepID=UPI001F0586B9|nr:IclR family transcriptional regulator [Nocardioides sp. CFH 31398]MCH1868808.1 IclR family transcriptional regulator [Nocardioides sp. CFH 31398]